MLYLFAHKKNLLLILSHICFICICIFVLSFRKRSRDEDSSDFMPISKRINNLSISSQCFGEQETLNAQSMVIPSYLMAINNQENEFNHFAHSTSANHGYSNDMQQHHEYQNHDQPTNNHNIHLNSHQNQIHSINHHSNGFNNLNHSSIGGNDIHSHNHIQKQSQNDLIQPSNAELNNNQMEVYCPELTADENPIYYNKNKLLFDLHIERQRRNQNHQ